MDGRTRRWAAPWRWPRSDAFAWSDNLLGRAGYVLSPLAVGFAAARVGWGPSIATTAVFPLVAVALIWKWLPETTCREVEETSATGWTSVTLPSPTPVLAPAGP